MTTQEFDDVGLMTEPVPALVAILRQYIALSIDPINHQISVDTEQGRITQQDIQQDQVKADIPQVYVSGTNFFNIAGGCIETLDYDITITILCVGGTCAGLTKHQWAKRMVTIVTKILLKHGGGALKADGSKTLSLDRSSYAAVSLDTTQSRLAGLGIWQITINGQSELDLSDI